MYDVTWLLYASITVWAGLGIYLFLLSRRSNALEKRLHRLEQVFPGNDK